MTESTGSTGSQNTGGATASSSDVLSQPSTPEVPSYKGTKHKIDFDGHEVELDYDTLVGDFKRFAKESYQLKSQLDPAMELLTSLQKGDLSQLKRLGISDDVIRSFSEKQLMEYIEYQNMDPRERTLKEREAKIEAMERRVKEQEEAEKNSRLEAERAAANKQVQSDLIEAIKDLGGDFKVTPRMIRRVAEEAYARIEAGQTPDLKSIAKRQWDGLASDYTEFQSMMLKRDPKSFISSLPPELIKAIREHDLSGARPIKKVEVEKENGFVPEKKGLGLDESFKALDNYYNRKRKQRMNQ
jgi:hypothetical protein